MDFTQVIHFGMSHLHWITRSEGSHGWFQLDAVLKWFPPDHEKAESFVLAAAVPAGRMYAPSGPLLKQPPYSFQMIAGELEHTILRRQHDYRHPNVPSDSSQPHHQNFENLNWQLSHSLAQPLHPEALASLPQTSPHLNLVIEAQHLGGSLRLEMPVRHWNHRSDPTGWQIETGPGLWPLDLHAFTAQPNTRWLTPAWIHTNRADRVTMSGDRLPCHELDAQLSLLALT